MGEGEGFFRSVHPGNFGSRWDGQYNLRIKCGEWGGRLLYIFDAAMKKCLALCCFGIGQQGRKRANASAEIRTALVAACVPWAQVWRQ